MALRLSPLALFLNFGHVVLGTGWTTTKGRHGPSDWEGFPRGYGPVPPFHKADATLADSGASRVEMLRAKCRSQTACAILQDDIAAVARRQQTTSQGAPPHRWPIRK